jgi:hypothetical protein
MYSPMSKITIGDNYSQTYSQYSHEKWSNQSFRVNIFRPKYGVNIFRQKYWRENIQTKIWRENIQTKILA